MLDALVGLYVSWQTAVRMPRILFAATDAPTPDPQMRIPAVGRCLLDRHARALGEVGVVVLGIGAVAAEVDELVAPRSARRSCAAARA